PGSVGAHRLETALGIANPGPQHDVQEDVVAARNHLALEPARDTRTGRQAASDRDVAVPRNERGDKGEECIEVGGEIDIHVGHDRRVAPEPGMTNRPAASLLAKMLGANAWQLER